MTADRYDKAREIFDRAETLSGSERESFLDQACGGDEELRGRVDALLHARAKLGRFLEDRATVWQDEKIGAFSVDGVIAEGGMGIVLKATQDQPRRSVAIKLIRGSGFTQQALQRFELEAEVLGRLDHPGVARIYEAGATQRDGESLPYFVMEYIEGLSLTRYARQNDLGERRCIELMIDVCEAVHHAHLRGVVHRDLKPSNILVREDGQPKVLDFGVARVTDGDLQLTTVHTQVGQILGTLPYMSPEQVSGKNDQLDLRSDIYALGVLLFELLTGRLPQALEDRELVDAVRVIAEEDPRTLSAGGQSYASDLETIVAKCLRKEPDRRYASAAEFSQDLRRYLRNEPISARPASAAYQWSKFARRNRAAVAWAAVALVSLVVGLAFSLANLATSRIERNNAVTAAAEATELSDFLVELLTSPDPRQQGGDVKVRDLLDSASSHAQEQLADRPGVAARVHQALAFSFRGLGQDDLALQELESALRAARSMEEAGPRLLEAYLDLISLHAEVGADAVVESLLIEAEPLLLHVESPSPLLYRYRMHEGILESYTGELEAAETMLEAVFAEARVAFGAEARIVRDLRGEVGRVVWRARKAEKARVVFEEAVEVETRLAGPDDPVTLKFVNNLGMAYKQLEDYPRAKTMLERALDTKIRTLGAEHPSTATGHHNLALVLREVNELDEAAEHHRRALAVAEALFSEEDPRVPHFRSGYAGTLFRQQQYEQARALHLASLEPLLKMYGAGHPRVRKIFEELAASSDALGDEAAAREWRQRASRDD